MIAAQPAALRTRQSPLRRPGDAQEPPRIAADCPAWFAEASHGQQRVGALSALPAVLRAFGVNPLQVLAPCGLRADALDNPEDVMSFPAMIQLLETAAHAAACPHIGLKLAATATLVQMGALGDALRHDRPSIGDALRTFVDHQRLHGEGLAAFTLDHGDCLEFGFVALWAGSQRRMVIYDTTAAVAAAWVQELTSGALRPKEVCLPRLRPGDAAIYREHFGCRVAFESDHAALLYDKSSLSRAVRQPDPPHRRQPERALALPDEDLVTALYRSIRLLLTAARTPHSAALAQQCQSHERTLRRRLAARGVHYRDVLDQVRYDLARQLLAETRRDMGDIAQACAYGDATAFQRAFRRWSGLTPGEWRTHHSAVGEAAAARGQASRRWHPVASALSHCIGERA